MQEDLIPDSELEYQEQLIAEREGEIREIESGVLELNEIFRDLGTIVTEQQSMLDNIESNVISIANDTGGAAEELVQAHEYQRKAGRRMFCLMLIFIVVMAIVLLAVSYLHCASIGSDEADSEHHFTRSCRDTILSPVATHVFHYQCFHLLFSHVSQLLSRS